MKKIKLTGKMINPNEQPNPRFVMVVGAIREVYSDIPEYVGENGQLVIWDRQEQIAAVTVSRLYSQALCLETTRHSTDYPFTNLENWLNALDNECLVSEGMVPTRPEYRPDSDKPNVACAIREGKLLGLIDAAKELIPETANDVTQNWHEEVKGMGL